MGKSGWGLWIGCFLISFCLTALSPGSWLSGEARSPGPSSIQSTWLAQSPSSENEAPETEASQEPAIEDVTPLPTQSVAIDQDKLEEIAASEKYPVLLEGKTLFELQGPLGPTTAEQRAQRTSQRVRNFANNPLDAVENLEIVQLEELTMIVIADRPIVVLDRLDGALEETSTKELAAQYLERLIAGVAEYRSRREADNVGRALIKTGIVTACIVATLTILNTVFGFFLNRLQQWRESNLNATFFENIEFLSAARIAILIATIAKLIRAGFIIAILYFYIPFALSFFPQTRAIGNRLLELVGNTARTVGQSIIGYLPNLVFIIAIALVALYSIRFSKVLFHALGQGSVTLPGFYPEWSAPTHKIIVFLIVSFAAVLMFPYLPAAGSQGFQGISIFIGALITFGSSGVIANLVSGIIMIYTRAFQIGDRISVGDVTGDVLEKTILSTRLITTNNEIITIPNATLIITNIINFSAIIREENKPLVLHTTITLGYDVPWRKVHEVLIAAAFSTSDISESPAPFVLQTSLDDFYVSYELKAFTHSAHKMPLIYSELHQNIQDQCNEADIEILSPHYNALRDGNQITIPADYLPTNYNPPGFRVNPLKNSP
ncbi:MAG: mechanosensitive ion channel family protein [Cyanobacteria bacterium P01_H01_bin.15]